MDNKDKQAGQAMIEYTWRYCPECDDDYMTLEDGETCVICGCELETKEED